MDFESVLPCVENLLILDSEGKRIAVKYYGDSRPAVTEQAAFEKDAFSKINRNQSQRVQADILLFNEVAVLYKRVEDLIFIVTGSQEENEVILNSVLTALVEALNVLMRGVVGKKTVLENLDLVLIAIDEICDDGLSMCSIILEVDGQTIAQRATMRGDGGMPEGAGPLGSEASTFSMALASAKQQLTRSLLNV